MSQCEPIQEDFLGSKTRDRLDLPYKRLVFRKVKVIKLANTDHKEIPNATNLRMQNTKCIGIFPTIKIHEGLAKNKVIPSAEERMTYKCFNIRSICFLIRF